MTSIRFILLDINEAAPPALANAKVVLPACAVAAVMVNVNCLLSVTFSTKLIRMIKDPELLSADETDKFEKVTF